MAFFRTLRSGTTKCMKIPAPIFLFVSLGIAIVSYRAGAASHSGSILHAQQQVVVDVNASPFLSAPHPHTIDTSFPSSSSSCELSMKESYGFFCEPDLEWNKRKDVWEEQQPRQEVYARPGQPVPKRSSPLGGMMSESAIYWQANWEPNFHCRYKMRPGQPSDGAKWICDPYRIKEMVDVSRSASQCLIYSVGSANSYHFEEAMHALLPSCEIFTFDPTVKNPTPPSFVSFHKIGVAAVDHTKGGQVFKTLESIMKDLNHTGRMIDLFKIDVEGAEYDSLLPLIEKGGFDHVRQLQVELHYQFSPCPEHIDHHIGRTIHNGTMHNRFFRALQEQGWVIYSKEPNVKFSYGGCIEYGLIRLDWGHKQMLARAEKQYCPLWKMGPFAPYCQDPSLPGQYNPRYWVDVRR